MLKPTNYTANLSLIHEAIPLIPSSESSYVLNKPTGSFFYDPWVIDEQYQNTVWEKILNTLPVTFGEARVIVLPPTKSYHTHADIDDRYHLNINGEHCYLIDFNDQKLHKLEQDGCWYDMDAGRLHSASNFGRFYRIQLVVRKLLNQPVLVNYKTIKVTAIGDHNDSRFLFDNTYSVWLNAANKSNLISNFKFSLKEVTFKLDISAVDDFRSMKIDNFNIEVI